MPGGVQSNAPSALTTRVPAEGTGVPTTVRSRLAEGASLASRPWDAGTLQLTPYAQLYASSAAATVGGSTRRFTQAVVSTAPSVIVTQNWVSPEEAYWG